MSQPRGELHNEVVLTVGHSNHDEQVFIDLLRGAAVQAIADVRRQPRSGRYPHFNAAALAASLEGVGITYAAMGEHLGGRREPVEDSPNTAWNDDGFRGYADHMASPEFAAGLELLEAVAAARRAAIMCAEGDWRQCHRRLVSDVLTLRGRQVLHLAPDGSISEHELDPNAVVEEGRITYPVPGQTSLRL